MKLVIITSNRENYGSEDKPSWKNKFGETYVVENITPGMKAKIEEEGIPTLTKLIEYDNPMSIEQVAYVRVVEDDAEVCEEWESPHILAYNTITKAWEARVTVKNDGVFRSNIKTKFASWELLENNERSNYVCQYELTDGRMVTEAQYRDEM